MQTTSDTQTPIVISGTNFADEVLNSATPILLDFWAPWCVPCMIMKRGVEKVADQLHGTARVGLVNVDEEPELVARFGVQGTPVFMLLEKGEVLDVAVGMRTANGLSQRVQSVLQARPAAV